MEVLKWVNYYRVSTVRQGKSQLGLEAQRTSCERFLNGVKPIAEFTEIVSGRENQREELARAIALCRNTGARLLCAKSDRIARRYSFLAILKDSGVSWTAADNPHLDEFSAAILILVAEREAELCSIRVRESLAEIKRRGIKKLGNPRLAETALQPAIEANRLKANAFAESLKPVLNDVITVGKVTSFLGISRVLNARGLRTVQDKPWQAQTVKNLMQRIGI